MAVQAKYMMSSTLLLSLLTLAGCNKPADAPQQPSASASAATTTAQAAPPYTPPSADQLSQMVAPIALFPDKLVGQVLAGATYPAQITDADQWLAQNPSLKGDALQSAEAAQPWDVSVKSLTAFPSVLDQMAGNIQWTTSLGQAYANDPNDVMNAIQVMRLRAQQAGNLKSSPHLRVSSTVRPAPPPNYIDQPPPDQVLYAGPEVIPAPPQTIIIEPTEPDVVYVPRYNPTVVYGAPVPVYPGWHYREPEYATSDLVTTGAISFGIGILVGAAVSHHHDSGWNAWGVNWGGPGHGGGGGGGDWHRPAVVYNNNTYVTKSVTVVNRVNNINVTNNNYRGAPAPAMVASHGAPMRPMQPMPQAGPMTVPHFTPHDMSPGARPPVMAASHGPVPQAMAQHDFRQQPNMAQPAMADRPHMANMPPQAEANRAHAMQAQAQEHSAQPMHMPPAMQQQQHQQQQQQHQPPIQHADAGTQREPMQHREALAQQPHAMHENMPAMHQHPAAQPQHAAQPRHEEKHEQAAHHDQHDKPEHHG